MTKRRLFSALTVFLFIFISVTSLLPSDLNAQTSKVWVEGYWEDVTENVWVKSGYNTHTWVDTSHWENQNVWVNTSHWQWVSSGYSKNVWVESGYWKSVWVDTSHNVWVEMDTLKIPGLIQVIGRV